jgi:23S rRNA (cytosine1962-C5)-methyltransferase
LDHAPLRRFLARSVNPGAKIANLFCYTGTLGLAGVRSGAASLVQVDLSRPVLEWARENASLLTDASAEIQYCHEDAFAFLERQRRKAERYDWILVDPPSFSRNKDGKAFSVQKDTAELVSASLRVLQPRGGTLVFSTNSAELRWSQLDDSITQACVDSGVGVRILRTIVQEEQFPARWQSRAEERYLKGYVLQTTGNPPEPVNEKPSPPRTWDAEKRASRNAKAGGKPWRTGQKPSPRRT